MNKLLCEYLSRYLWCRNSHSLTYYQTLGICKRKMEHEASFTVIQPQNLFFTDHFALWSFLCNRHQEVTHSRVQHRHGVQKPLNLIVHCCLLSSGKPTFFPKDKLETSYCHWVSQNWLEICLTFFICVFNPASHIYRHHWFLHLWVEWIFFFWLLE